MSEINSEKAASKGLSILEQLNSSIRILTEQVNSGNDVNNAIKGFSDILENIGVTVDEPLTEEINIALQPTKMPEDTKNGINVSNKIHTLYNSVEDLTDAIRSYKSSVNLFIRLTQSIVDL